jgi:hypothetical protein
MKKKEYCSYWLRTGECDFTQQGCIYKHEMPRDPRVLESLGLRGIPNWYVMQHGSRVRGRASFTSRRIVGKPMEMLTHGDHADELSTSIKGKEPQRPATNALASPVVSKAELAALRPRIDAFHHSFESDKTPDRDPILTTNEPINNRGLLSSRFADDQAASKHQILSNSEMANAQGPALSGPPRTENTPVFGGMKPALSNLLIDIEESSDLPLQQSHFNNTATVDAVNPISAAISRSRKQSALGSPHAPKEPPFRIHGSTPGSTTVPASTTNHKRKSKQSRKSQGRTGSAWAK